MILHLSFRLFCFYFLLVLPAHRAVTDCGHTDFKCNKWPFDRASSLAHPVLCVSPLCGILRDKPGCQLWVCVPLPSVISLKKKWPLDKYKLVKGTGYYRFHPDE